MRATPTAAAAPGPSPLLHCCLASGCRLQGADQLWAVIVGHPRVALAPAALARAEEGQPAAETRSIEARAVGCLGLCGAGPLLACDGGNHPGLYGALSTRQLQALLDGVNSPEASIGPQPAALAAKRIDPELPFFRAQTPLVLQHCGWIDPQSIDSALSMGTYGQLLHCLDGRSPAEVRAMVTQSGLRGRGGAGFPTGLKWERVASETATPKLVVANGDEGDPGAFMDRTVMESDPHRLLEGLAIAAYAVGAEQGVLFVRAEYGQAVAQLRRAIAEAEAQGWLGAEVAGRRFRFRVSLRVGAGAYVCGEETALMAAIEGRRGLPRPRPPYPARSGLWGQPTLINNVETLAAIPAILAVGPEAYAAIGRERSRGTKVFSLSGAIRHSGVVEVPMGLSLRQLVEEIGGGAPPGRRIKAVQTGGPTGGFVPLAQLDTPIDYEALTSLGSAMGSGGLVVIDDDTPIPELVRHLLRFSASESCGKCVPCRVGTTTLLTLLEQLHGGGGDRGPGHGLALIEELAAMVRACSLCGLGQGAANPLLSGLRHFPSEFSPAPGAGSAPTPAPEAGGER